MKKSYNTPEIDVYNYADLTVSTGGGIDMSSGGNLGEGGIPKSGGYSLDIFND